MKILVTGATGFIGTYIIKTLYSQGRDFAIFDLNPPTPMLRDLVNDSNWIQGDIRDPNLVNQTIGNYRPEVIIHLASLMYEGSNKNPRDAIEINVLGLSNVLEAARQLGVKRVVTASSGGVYEGTSHPRNEHAEISPNVSLYGACKFLNEILCRQYTRNYGMETTSLRCAMVYGPGEITSPGFAREVKKIESIAIGKTVTVDLFAASDPFTPLFVADAARAFMLAATVPGPLSPVYNIGVSAGDPNTIGDFVALIQKLAPGSGNVIFNRENVPEGIRSKRTPFDTSRAEKELGFVPEYSLENGVEELIDYLNTTRAN